MIQNRFCEILQNLHFVDNRRDDKTDRAFKMRPVTGHINSEFSKVLYDILSVQRRKKGSKTKSLVPGPNAVKLYYSSMSVVDLMDSVLLHIVRIESHLLDFTSAFSLIWWISHISIVTSFITWSIVTNCLSLITRLSSQKT